MGASQSKLATNHGKSLEELSVEEVRRYVTDLGAKYNNYGDAIAENAVDGEVLASIGCEDEMKETLECLEITNFLHQKVLLKEWNRARGQPATAVVPQKTAGLQRSETSFTTATMSIADASEITLDTALSTSAGTYKEYARRLSDNSDKEQVAEATGVSTSQRQQQQAQQQQEAQQQVQQMPRYPGAPSDSDIPITISVEHQVALEPLQLPKDETLLPPDAPELEPFRQLAQRVLRELHGSIAETNIVDISHFEDRKGMNNLAAAFPPEANISKAMRCHFDQPNDLEICRRFVLGQNEEYYEEYVPAEVAIANGLTEAGRYYGQVIKIGDLRVGTICSIVEERNWSKTTDAKRQESLRLLATLMEDQLQQRQVLLQRNQNLRQDIDQLKSQSNGATAGGESVVLAPPYGPIKAVTSVQVAGRETLFPYPREADVATQDNGHPTSPSYTRRSSTLPSWHFTRQATTEAERSHLHPNYWNHPAFPGHPNVDPTPIGKHDMERVAMVNSLQILQIDPMSQEAQTIQSLLNMCGNLLEAEFVYISVVDHEHCYIFFPTFPKGRGDGVIPASWQTIFTDGGEVLQRHPHTGEPIVWRQTRNGAICNYPLMSPNNQSFVVHDMARDQSLSVFKEESGFGFYSGSPIVLRGQAVGVLCCICQDARPDFERAQEVQQEQLAHLIAQQYDTWYLKREMQKLERERIMLRKTGPPTPPPSSGSAASSSNSQDLRAMCRIRTNLPEDYATLIFTSIQGFYALREANPEATEKALGQYSRVLRTKVAEHGGYEVNMTEDGSSFHIAFTDVIDAVKFCLQTQEALYAAPWEQDLLALSAACDDPRRSFRGLRVRMAIHCGDVETSRSPQAPGDVVYEGETHHVAKNLESMCHGGQILLTSDVWNIASNLVESSLGSPQVVDLGSHVIPSKSSRMQDGITTKSLLQLVPKSLAHDYVESRRLSQVGGAYDPNNRVTGGRVFPTIKTKKSVSASFHHAPFEGNKVVMLSVDTGEVETMAFDSRMLLVALSNRISTILSDGCHSGYQCKDFLLAFDEVSDAVRFGLALQENLEKEDILERSLGGRVRIGVQEGHFETMGPNPSNGKAEYFGEIVDRVPLIAESAAPGSVYLGKEATGMDEFDLMPATNGFMLNFSGRRFLEGVQEEFALYKCHPCKSWYDQMLDNRRCNLSQPWRRY